MQTKQISRPIMNDKDHLIDEVIITLSDEEALKINSMVEFMKKNDVNQMSLSLGAALWRYDEEPVDFKLTCEELKVFKDGNMVFAVNEKYSDDELESEFFSVNDFGFNLNENITKSSDIFNIAEKFLAASQEREKLNEMQDHDAAFEIECDQREYGHELAEWIIKNKELIASGLLAKEAAEHKVACGLTQEEIQATIYDSKEVDVGLSHK